MLNLQKAEQAVLDLTKDQGIFGQQAGIVSVDDYSSSMSTFYNKSRVGNEWVESAVQRVKNRILPVGMAFSPDKVVDAYFFHNTYFKAKEQITEDNLAGFVERNTYGKSMGGTSYAPVINAIAEEYRQKYNYRKEWVVTSQLEPINWFLAIIYFIFGIRRKTTEEKFFVDVPANGEPADGPLLVFYFTDGENDDQHAAKRALEDCAGLPIFWQFIGVEEGGSSFSNLRELDEMESRYIDNANLMTISIKKLNSMSDKEIYDLILNEFGRKYIPLAKSDKYRLIKQ